MRHGMVWRGSLWLITIHDPVGHGEVRLGGARQGRVRLGRAREPMAHLQYLGKRCGMAWYGWAGSGVVRSQWLITIHGRAGRGWVWYGMAR